MYPRLSKKSFDPIISVKKRPKFFSSILKANQSTENVEEEENKNDDFTV